MRKRELARAAAAAGLKLSPQARRAWLPPARCSEDDRALAAQLAAARGLSLSEHIRTRALAPLTDAEKGRP